MKHDSTASMLDKYAAWVHATCACKACESCPASSISCLVNKNLDPAFANMPQAGYLGPDYQNSAHRVLVLGKNPAGGPDGDQANDDKHYPLLLKIVDQPSLKEFGIDLQCLYSRWAPLKTLNLEKNVGLKLSEIAYSNQILCRSDNHHSDTNRGLIGCNRWSDIRPIYVSCFHNRLLQLIQILEPNHIVVLGKKKKLDESWPHIFQSLMVAHLPLLNVKIWPVRFPRHFYDWKSDLAPLRQDLGILV